MCRSKQRGLPALEITLLDKQGGGVTCPPGPSAPELFVYIKMLIRNKKRIWLVEIWRLRLSQHFNQSQPWGFHARLLAFFFFFLHGPVPEAIVMSQSEESSVASETMLPVSHPISLICPTWWGTYLVFEPSQPLGILSGLPNVMSYLVFGTQSTTRDFIRAVQCDDVDTFE